MPDELKNFLSRELDEIKRNKNRTGVLGACLVALMIFSLTDDDSRSDEINLNESATPPPVTKDLPVKPLPVTKIDGVTLVLGANADALTVADPFAGAKKNKPPTKSVATIQPPVIFQPPPIPQPVAPREKIFLTGTAISGNVKTAMFMRGKETLFLTIGDELDGRRIVDVTPDFVMFADGARVYLQKEVN